MPVIYRAAHQIFDENPKILDDPNAIGLVEGSSEEEMRAQEASFKEPNSLFMRSSFVLRNRFAEDWLAERVKSGVQQYVLLGAGLDTFAYRQPDWALSLQIIEVDFPDSQTFKLERLNKVGTSIPENVYFCPIDFEKQSLQEGLGSEAFNPQVPTVFSCLAVTQFLTLPAIEEVFRFVASMPLGSSIVFTFILLDELLEGEEQKMIANAASGSATFGEPWITRFAPQPLQQWLLDLGFSEVFHLTPELASEKYFLGRKDQLCAPTSEQLMCGIA